MGVTITYYGHSCFVLESGGYRLAVDPYDGHVPGYAPLRIQADEVLCSHEHMDHFYKQAVQLSRAGRESPFAVTALPIPHDDAGGCLRGMNRIHLFTCGGLRIAHFGDFGCHPDKEIMEQLRGLDAAMIPVGGIYTIDAVQARALLDELGARVSIPMHYRVGGCGFEVLDTVEPFAALSGNLVHLGSNQLTIEPGMERQTVILTYVP